MARRKTNKAYRYRRVRAMLQGMPAQWAHALPISITYPCGKLKSRWHHNVCFVHDDFDREARAERGLVGKGACCRNEEKATMDEGMRLIGGGSLAEQAARYWQPANSNFGGTQADKRWIQEMADALPDGAFDR